MTASEEGFISSSPAVGADGLIASLPTAGKQSMGGATNLIDDQ